MALIPALRRLWKALPVPKGLRPMVGLVLFHVLYVPQRVSRLAARVRPSPVLSGSLVVSGFFGQALGIGRAARLTADALEAASFACTRQDLGPLLDEPMVLFPKPAEFPDEAGGVWIIHCNAPEAARVLRKIPHRLWRNRYRIGVWVWELETLPESWIKTARDFHEIWAPSAFAAEAIRPHVRTVRVMPHPFPPAPAPLADRSRFGLPAEGLLFAALADGRSTFARKNPLGAVEAFKRAFPKPSAGAHLVVKLIHGDEDPEGMAALKTACAGRPDISLYTKELRQDEIGTFLASIDALISLHRSEGFGLVIAEAMALGKPVIATGWSGNVDFMTGDAGGGLVPFILVPPNDPTGRYQGVRWAEPNLGHGARLIRKLAEEPAFFKRLSEAGPPAVGRLNEPWTRARLMDQSFPEFLLR